ncbi:FxsB family radical SAM/SPASM domain protein [Merismopedia glauca CCAP 1448/3]|uniref:FxsB family radical SAM/SPASM domain protein n=2 Tax=Merismopedia TaxID=53402 RepID=A0A2T1C2J1_9CYAN|nr:FxsB family radical SAM/SPASM domain protein [Merismopedia glauca CCAP 1448/3]
MHGKPQITCFLVKIASRCNLACDYCYIYRHADRGWQKQPFRMSQNHRQLLASRIGEYVEVQQLKEIVVVFHGGEPLLAGVETIVETASWVQAAVPSWCKVGFSLQTNGVLLTQPILARLEQMKIGVSLSIDGYKEAHDRHRLDRKGNSSFDAVEKSLQMLKAYPAIYSGAIAVIDPLVHPKGLFEFFSAYQPPQLDFLLPDANHCRLPPGRDRNPNLYVSWLLEAFDIWFSQYSHIPVRTFDAILGSLAGIPSHTDSFGFGDVSLLTIETDGSYHDLDVLKITSDGMTSLGTTLDECDIATIVASSTQIQNHRRLLAYEGLALQCQNCSVVDICGGGSIPHRYAADGFIHPTVYCLEMETLINHARERLQRQLDLEMTNRQIPSVEQEIDFDVIAFESPETSKPAIEFLLKAWLDDANKDFQSALKWSFGEVPEQLDVIEKIQFSIKNGSHIAIYPSIGMWTSVVKRKMAGIKVHTIDDDLIVADTRYPKKILELLKTLDRAGMQSPLIHRDDECLRIPFGTKILFEDEENATQGRKILQESLKIISSWRPTLVEEMRSISPEVQFIRDLTAHPEKIVSFSDNSVPGALYVSIKQDSRFVDPCDLADSLIHEHRHQKLYLLQRSIPLVARDTPLVSSPWREDLRPPSGLLHAVFVFTHLLEFWLYLSKQGNRDKARRQVKIIQSRLLQGITTLRSTALTKVGFNLLDRLESILKDSTGMQV